MIYFAKRSVLTSALCLVAAGCTGSIDHGGQSSGSGSTGNGPAAGGGNGGNGAPVQPGSFIPSASRLRRLTTMEYKNSIVDLLGSGTQVTTELEKDAVFNNLTSIAAASVSLTATATEQFEASANSLAAALVKDTARRAQVVGCTPSGATDQVCLQSFVSSFGRRAFRRPLATEEVTLYTDVGKAAMAQLSDFWGGVQYSLSAILQSPNFLYRTEFGLEASSGPGRPLDGYEIASRLSYLLWASTPDGALLDAAAAGLQTPAAISEQAARLLASPRAEGAVMSLLSEMLRLSELDDIAPDATLFPNAQSETLAASFRTETQSVLRDLVLTRDADYREFFTSNETFVNAELATLYGLPVPAATGFVKVTLPANGPRAGYLGQGSFLALNARRDHASPTLRGLAIVTGVLCDSIPPPPTGVVTEIAEKDKSKTAREQLSVHQTDPTCAGCHSRMDPMGLALEHFDAVGAYRETDRGMPIDASGTLYGVAFNDARGLGQALADGAKTAEGNPETSDCLVRNLFRAATGHVEAAGDEAVVTALSSAFASDGFKVKSALSKLVISDAFRFIGKPE